MNIILIIKQYVTNILYSQDFFPAKFSPWLGSYPHRYAPFWCNTSRPAQTGNSRYTESLLSESLSPALWSNDHDRSPQLLMIWPSGLYRSAAAERPAISNVEMEKNLYAALQAAVAKLDLVTREEFDVQQAVLARTRAKVDDAGKAGGRTGRESTAGGKRRKAAEKPAESEEGDG
jgi:hypothetical protein